MYFDKSRQSVNRIQNEEEIFTRRTFMPTRVMRFAFFLFHNKIRIYLQYYVTRLSKLKNMATMVLNVEVASDNNHRAEIPSEINLSLCLIQNYSITVKN